MRRQLFLNGFMFYSSGFASQWRFDRMRKFLVVAGALTVLTVPALGADLPSTKAPPVALPPPIFSWDGFYAGVQGGGGWSHESGLWGDAMRRGLSPYAINAGSGLAGGYVGYNWQFANLVLGLEGDGNGVIGGPRSTTTVYNALGLNGNPVGTNPYGIDAQQTWNADIRGRVGLAIDRTLLYVAGGAAFGDVKTSYAGPLNVTANRFLTETTQRVGWTIGGGVEYAFTNNILGRIEYRYADLGSKSFTQISSGSGNYDDPRWHSSAVLAGVSYKFGSHEPGVAAAY
jgi:outer membrane immunogenic protein